MFPGRQASSRSRGFFITNHGRAPSTDIVQPRNILTPTVGSSEQHHIKSEQFRCPKNAPKLRNLKREDVDGFEEANSHPHAPSTSTTGFLRTRSVFPVTITNAAAGRVVPKDEVIARASSFEAQVTENKPLAVANLCQGMPKNRCTRKRLGQDEKRRSCESSAKHRLKKKHEYDALKRRFEIMEQERDAFKQERDSLAKQLEGKIDLVEPNHQPDLPVNVSHADVRSDGAVISSELAAAPVNWDSDCMAHTILRALGSVERRMKIDISNHMVEAVSDDVFLSLEPIFRNLMPMFNRRELAVSLTNQLTASSAVTSSCDGRLTDSEAEPHQQGVDGFDLSR